MERITTIALVVLIAVLAVLAILLWRSRITLRRAQRQDRTLREALDIADAAFVLYDADDRLVLASRTFRDLYDFDDAMLQPGRSFEAITRDALERDKVPEARQDPDAWLQQRLRLHREGGWLLRRMVDGRWRRISEQMLRDGSRVGFSIDVTDQVEKGQALESARAEAQRSREQLEDAIEAMPAGFELYDSDDRLVLANSVLRDFYPRVADMLSAPGATFEEIVRTNIAAGGMPLIGEAGVEAWLARRREERGQSISRTLQQADGRWLRTIERRTREGWRVGIRVDMTETIAQREAAERASRRLQDAIDALPGGFTLFDQEDRLEICNQRYRDLYPESAAGMVLGASFESVLRYGLEHKQFTQAIGRESDWLRERIHRHRHPGESMLEALAGNRWLRIDERVTHAGGVVSNYTDVSELVRREQALQRVNDQLDDANMRLEALSDTDGLTNIANRRLFDRRLADEWLRARRHRHPLSLLMIDIDHFKLYNDAHGHQEGDDCLRRVATLLQSCTRRSSDLVARYGGEEFAILLPHTDLDEAQALAEQCLAVLDATAVAQGLESRSRVTLSAGVACAGDPGTSGNAKALVGAADGALYRAKQNGRHCVRTAAPI